MIDKIKEILLKNKIEHYRINCVNSKSVEMFFIKKETDMLRSTEITEYSVTVYRDFMQSDVKMRGHSTALVFPDMTEEEISRAVNNAYYAASFVKNKFYELPKPSKTLMLQKREYNLKEEAFKLAEALFSAEKSDGKSFINSAEIFAVGKISRVVNSEGIDVEYSKYNFNGEFVTQAVADDKDVEIHTQFSYNEPEYEQLTAKVEEALITVHDRLEAKGPAPAGKYDIILTGANLATILDYYTERTQGSMIYAGYSSYQKGSFLQGDENEIKGERLNITLKATQPYSAEGIAMQDRVLSQEGILKTIHCGARFAHYLGLEATGDYGAFECGCGTENFEDMKKGALYIAVFSDFQMDSFTGQFGGEIRLAYLFEEKDGKMQVKKFTGGSINGSIFEAQKEMMFSKERYKDDSYEGPYAIKLKRISIAGS